MKEKRQYNLHALSSTSVILENVSTIRNELAEKKYLNKPQTKHLARKTPRTQEQMGEKNIEYFIQQFIRLKAFLSMNILKTKPSSITQLLHHHLTLSATKGCVK